MKKPPHGKSTASGVLIIGCLLCSLVIGLPALSQAKVYIDITSPAFRKLPISIRHAGAEEAREIAEIVEADLDFTGIFYPIDPAAPGAEIRVEIEAEVEKEIRADVQVLDLIANKRILNKRYTATKRIIRTLAHSISNDIFRIMTGRKGIFRTKLSYIVSSAEKKWLYLMDWDGRNPVRIVTRGLTVSHSWAQDGRSILFTSERKKKWGIYSLNLTNYREAILFSSEGINLIGGIARDGRIAFSSSKDGSPEIYVMNSNGSGYRKLTRSFGIDVSPVFSPDGSEIAYVSDRGGTPQIYITDSDGRRTRRVTFEGSYNTSPAWSPDGQWIAYVGRKNGKNQIFMIQSDGSDMRQMTEMGNNENPAFSPDGMFLAFDSDREGLQGIYLMHVRSLVSNRITGKEISAMNPQWSPYIK